MMDVGLHGELVVGSFADASHPSEYLLRVNMDVSVETCANDALLADAASPRVR